MSRKNLSNQECGENIRFTEHLLMGIHGCLVTATTEPSSVLRFINQKYCQKNSARY